MLALEHSYGVIGDLALFGDHADPKCIYYAQTRPRIARINGAPELSFVKFRTQDALEQGGIGLLSFTTDLTASEEQLEAAKKGLVEQGIAEPELRQLPWLSGKAVFAAALQEGDGFVEKLYGDVTPDLMGSNRATFSVLLADEGARLIEALLLNTEETSPLGVRYELEYAGIRPALHVRLRADYKRVYEELSWGFEVGVAYEGIGVRAGVESATQKLVESGAIKIEVLHFTDDADLHARVDQAIKWFQEKILEDFFQSALQPPAHENLLERAIAAAVSLGAATLQEALSDQNIAGQLAQALGVSPDVLGMLGQLAGGQGASGQSGGPGGAGGAESSFALKLQFSFRDINQEELRTVTLDWSEAAAEKRTAAPQGLLSRIGPRPTIIEAQDSGEFWDRLRVNVRPLGDFEALGVERLIVTLAYPNEMIPTDEKALTFEPGQSEPQSFAAWTDGNPRDYRSRSEVHFRDDGPWPGPPIFRGEWHSLRSLELAVHPLTEVPRVEIEISPGTLSFADTPQVQVDLRVNGQNTATHKLTAEQPTAAFRSRLEQVTSPPQPEPAPPVEPSVPPAPLVEARTTWFLAEGGRVEGNWSQVEGTALLIHAPWRSHRTVRLFPLLPDDFIEAMVTLTLKEDGRTRAAIVRFEAGERKTKAVSLPSLEEVAPPVQIDVLVIRGDGSTYIGQPYETTEPVILVRDREGEFRQVKVRLLAGPELAAHGLMAVQIQQLDSADEPIDSVVFTESNREPEMLLVPVSEDGSTKVRYQVVRYTLDGSAIRESIKEVPAGELLISAVAPS